VVKRSGRRVPFDRDKLQRSIDVALRKRSVEPERVERMINGVVRQLESLGDGEVTSEQVGALVMEGLKGSTTSPTYASRRSIRISAKPAISKSF
jgi:transcriptional repressor NrdR